MTGNKRRKGVYTHYSAAFGKAIINGVKRSHLLFSVTSVELKQHMPVNMHPLPSPSLHYTTKRCTRYAKIAYNWTTLLTNIHINITTAVLNVVIIIFTEKQHYNSFIRRFPRFILLGM